MALGYNNNLLYLFVFFIISVSHTGMVLTNQNVNRVEVTRIDFGNVFAEETNQFQIWLKNTSDKDALYLNVQGSDKWRDSNPELSGKIDKIGPDEIRSCQCTWTPKKRGHCLVPRISLQGSYPFSMLQAWKVFRQKNEVIVFPKREGQRQFPPQIGINQEKSEAGVFQELREFRSLDSLRRIDWRSTMRHQALQVRVFEDDSRTSVRIFNWAATSHLRDFESRVSQLALWVDMAEAQGGRYGVALPGFPPVLDSGNQHYQRIMQKLALLEPSQLAYLELGR